MRVNLGKDYTLVKLGTNMSIEGMKLDSAVVFMDEAIKQFHESASSGSLSVLDFGCGQGGLISGLAEQGYTSFGCDIDEYWTDVNAKNAVFRKIKWGPYSSLSTTMQWML